jgi:CRP-like cAMP-binding protein
LLEIGKSLCRIRLDAGETIIWEGEVNDDVFFLTRGALSILVTENGRERRVGVVRPGEVFGEMAFFSRDTRNATARALEPSECFVIKDSDLLLLVFKHPSILMQMAGALTRRLAGLNKRAASGELGPMSMR